MNLKTVKLASTRYLDDLPSEGNNKGVAIRDREMEKKVLELTRQMGIGAQFGGKYFCHDVRVIRLARHGASVPDRSRCQLLGDRQAMGKITRDGIFLEQLETNRALSARDRAAASLGRRGIGRAEKGMAHTLSVLTRHPVKTRVNLTGTLIVARDSAHAKLKERLDRGEGLPDYFKQFPVYYAGPAKTPQGMPSGSFVDHGGPHGFLRRSVPANGGSMVCWPRAIAASRSSTPARSTRASISLDRRPGRHPRPRTASGRSRCWNIPSSAWKRSGASGRELSGLSSSPTTRAMTSSAI